MLHGHGTNDISSVYDLRFCVSFCGVVANFYQNKSIVWGVAVVMLHFIQDLYLQLASFSYVSDMTLHRLGVSPSI